MKIKATPNHCVQHYFSDFESVLQRRGKCIFHPGEGLCKVLRNTPDCTIGGLDCHPFTRMRMQRDVPPHSHQQYQLVMEDYFAYLDHSMPKGGIVEEVLGFDQRIAQSQQLRERSTAATYKDLWLERLAQRGYSYVVLDLDNKTWFNSPKHRYFMLRHPFRFCSFHIIFPLLHLSLFPTLPGGRGCVGNLGSS